MPATLPVSWTELSALQRETHWNRKCTRCNGGGTESRLGPSWTEVPCKDCNGYGWDPVRVAVKS